MNIQQFAQGGAINSNDAVAVVSSTGGCAVQAVIPPARAGQNLNPSNFYQGPCGKTTFKIKTQNTGETYIPLGFFNLTEAIWSETNPFPFGTGLFKVAPASWVTNNSNVISTDNFNNNSTFAGTVRGYNAISKTMLPIVCAINVRSSDSDALDYLRTMSVVSQSISPQNQWAECTNEILANVCGPCVNGSGNDPVTFSLVAPLLANAGIFIPVPPGNQTGVTLTYEICICGYVDTFQYSDCGSGAVGGAY